MKGSAPGWTDGQNAHPEDAVAIGRATCYSVSGMNGNHPAGLQDADDACGPHAMLSPFKEDAWRRLTPAERLERSWRLRARLPDPQAVHDRKLFPKP